MPNITCYEQKIQSLTDFNTSGQRWYKEWFNPPWASQHVVTLREWLNYEFKNSVRTTAYIAEIGSNGGMFTHFLLKHLYDLGIPYQFNYSLFNHEVEHALTRRDAIRILDRSIDFDKNCRIRTYKIVPPSLVDPNLISCVRFNRKETYELLKDSQEYQLIVCYDSLHLYLQSTRSALIKAMVARLKVGGTIIINIPKPELDWTLLKFKLERATLVDKLFTDKDVTLRFSKT